MQGRGSSDHRPFFETSEDGMLLLDAARRIVDANPAACRLLGRGRRELLASGLGDVVDPSFPLIEAAQERGEGFFMGGVRLSRKDGTLFPAEVSLTRDEDGGTALIFNATEARRSAGDAAREAEERFEALVKNGLDLITLCDPDNTIRYMSPSVRRILGYEPEEMVGVFVPDVIHPDDLELAARESHMILTVPDYTPAPIRYRRKDGSYAYLETTFNNLTDDPVVRGIVANSRDVTEQVRAEEALKASEERFRALVENAQDFITVCDPDNTIRYVSPTVEKALGYRPEELVGRSLPELLHPDEREAAAREVERLNASPGPSKPLVYRYRHKDGRWVYLENVFTNLLDTPSVRGIVANSRDVTERVHAESALKESENRLRLAVEATELGTWDHDLATGTLRWDERCKALFGLPPDAEVDLETFFAGIHPEDRERVGELVESTLESGDGDDFWTEYRTVGLSDGALRWVAARGRAFSDETGTLRRFVGTLLDVTGWKEAEQEIRRLNEDLERRAEELARSNAELERFAYVVSHDLQAPLGRVEGFVAALLEDYAGQLDAEGRDFLRRIVASTRRMGRLVEGLFELSRVAGDEPRRERLDLAAIAGSVFEELRRTDPGRHAEFITPGEAPAHGDPRLLRVVLETLFENAWKSTAGRESARIEFGINGRGESATYYVRDDGAGFEASRAEELFRPFGRLHPGRELEGLGLAKARRIVERHGGRMWAEGEPERGATVYFSLRGEEWE